MQAVNTWDESQGAFVTHLQWQVYYALQNEYNANVRKMRGKRVRSIHSIKRKGRCHRSTQSYESTLPHKSRFDMDNFLSELSEEAKTAAHAALSLVLCKGEKERLPRAGDVKNFLVEAGWGVGDALRAITELKEALN
jgi:hypothetical protein